VSLFEASKEPFPISPRSRGGGPDEDVRFGLQALRLSSAASRSARAGNAIGPTPRTSSRSQLAASLPLTANVPCVAMSASAALSGSSINRSDTKLLRHLLGKGTIPKTVERLEVRAICIAVAEPALRSGFDVVCKGPHAF
jgi:hypothetical protein